VAVIREVGLEVLEDKPILVKSQFKAKWQVRMERDKLRN